MCKFASFVLTKDREFWSDTSDSHEQIIAENNLHADGARGPNVLRVELSPTDKIKVWPSLKAWAYKVDQDRMPEWFDAATAEKRARTALACRYRVGFTSVDASGCTSLTSLDAANATRYVDASGCTSLTSLDAANAGAVYASGCTSLTSLDAGKAGYVNASGCTSLTSLDAANATGSVYASGCTSLTSLDAGKAGYVDANGCTSLTSLDAANARYVDASGCDPKLVIKARKGATVIK